MRVFTANMTLMGTVTDVRATDAMFEIECRSGDKFTLSVTPLTFISVVRNLAGENQDRVPEPKEPLSEGSTAARLVHKYIKKGQLLAVTGLYQEVGEEMGSPSPIGMGRAREFVARRIQLLGPEPNRYNFEKAQWWLAQISTLADRWLDMLFGDKRSYAAEDFSKFYQTSWNIVGLPGDDNLQETATLSRLIYGLSSAYLLTGNDRYFRAAKAGVQYQRETFRMVSHDGRYCFWAFGKRKYGENLTKIIRPSENPDDAGAVPLYEQIYALAGLTQYYRITNDWDVLEDIGRTISAFNTFYLGPLVGDEVEKRKAQEDPLWEYYREYYGGYFSHIDFTTRRYDSESLGKNQSRKNWNSVGDHIPAYLVNLILAQDPVPKGREAFRPFAEEFKKMLVATTQLIVDRFPDPDPAVPYVNERFYADWTPDHQWFWQQNRAVVGHNLKIAWNLTRVANYFLYVAEDHESRGEGKEAEYWRSLAERNMQLANRLGHDMVDAGLDQLRGGCFDTVERTPSNGMPMQFAWENTKDFWQQEQAILAYLILCGCSNADEDRRQEYLQLARESAAVWNLFFLDQDEIGIRFRINDLGDPVIGGSYAGKGGHSISGYHAFELNYLAHIYTRAYVSACDGAEAAFTLYFKPDARNTGQQSINVLPDFFRPGDLVVTAVKVNGVRRPNSEIRPDDFRIELTENELGAEVAVEFRTRLPQRGFEDDNAATAVDGHLTRERVFEAGVRKIGVPV